MNLRASCVAAFLCLLVQLCAADFSPEVTHRIVKGIGWDILYFEDSLNVIHVGEKMVEMSYDDGVTWTEIETIGKSSDILVKFDPINVNRAFVFSRIGDTHFVTDDKGKTWRSFKVQPKKSLKDRELGMHHVFNFKDDLVLIKLEYCKQYPEADDCDVSYFYSSNSLKSDPQLLPIDAKVCVVNTLLDEPTILCVKDTRNSFGHVVKSELVSSKDLFKTSESIKHPGFDSGRIIDVRLELSFLVVVTQKDRFNELSLISISVSKDGKTFDTADLAFQMAYGAIRFLPSDPQSLFLTVAASTSKDTRPQGTLYSSDSSGLHFKKLLDNVDLGYSARVEYVHGVWLAKTFEEDPIVEPNDDYFGSPIAKTSSHISIDNGLTWNKLEILNDDSCKLKDGCSLNLLRFDAIEDKNKFVTGPTPNILMGFGITGNTDNFFKAKTYISRDGGLTWTNVFLGPGIHAFGDQGNVIMYVPFSGRNHGPATEVRYSLNQGRSWGTYKLKEPCFPQELITTTDGTNTKFILSGIVEHQQMSEVLYAFDFSKAFDGNKCKDSDMEKVYARVSPKDGQPNCIYGFKESFMRRKADARCFIDRTFEDVKVDVEQCPCTQQDYECSPYFKLSEKGVCVPDPKKIAEKCKSESKDTLKLPDMQIVAENKCEQKSDSSFVTETEFKCKDFTGENVPLLITIGQSEFDGFLSQYSYVATGPDLSDNLIVKTDTGLIYASNNGGTSFVRVPFKEKIRGFYVGPSLGRVIMITDGDVFYASNNGANTFYKYKVPTSASNGDVTISFHPTDESRFIWLSGNCAVGSSTCVAYHTEDFGRSFEKLIDNAMACDYVSPVLDITSTELIYCTVVDGNKKKLASSTNYFKEAEIEYVLDDIVAYAIKSNFVVVATLDEAHAMLKAKVTADGFVFADVDFPSDFKIEAQTAFTILESSPHSIFMHVTTDSTLGHEKGAILKSNSNGTYYVLSLSDVNRNEVGYVDYDRLGLLEGVLIANTATDSKEGKNKKTQISFNDGSQWNYIAPPAVDSDGKEYACKGQPLSKCSLHLHGFTERPDYRDTFSSGSAVGLLIGMGNVGEYLKPVTDDQTAAFMSADGGLTWKEIKKGVYHWDFGDQGTILLLVDAAKDTDEFIFSKDEGATWETMKFASSPVKVLDLATVPSDTSLKFVIFAGSHQSQSSTQLFAVDFSQFFPRQCQVDLENPESDDFEYWTPMHPESTERCLFGHEAMYLRRAAGHDDCFIGSTPLDQGYKMVRNCTCTRNDYECDYNYFRDNDGTCKLVKGMNAANRMAEMCRKPGVFEYFEPTGYRKIPLSTCVGGKQFDALKPRACPGHEKEFNEAHGRDVGGSKIFILIFIPLLVFFSAVFFVYDRGIRRNGGFQKLGQIRLDDGDDDFNPIEENTVDVVVNKTVRGAIVVAAGTFAVFKTIRKIDRAMFDKVTSLLFGRRPGQRNYVRVPDDEDELFGTFDENYEDELNEAADVDFNVDEEPEEFTELTAEPANVDERLFDIDDQSEDDAVSAEHPEPESTHE